MKLEVGKYYKTRDGRKVGPMKVDGAGLWSGNIDGVDTGYNSRGRFGQISGSLPNWQRKQEWLDQDIIAEWSDDQPKGPTLSSETIDSIALDSLRWHFKEGFDDKLTEEAFRIVIRYYGGSV